MQHPGIIQGGMGAGVSGWRLARAVAKMGQLGVVSGTALAVILARRLQLGDAGGHLRHALREFPIAGVAERIIKKYFVPGGKLPTQPYVFVPTPRFDADPEFLELTVVGNFVEVLLAKEGHSGPVGINYLEKIQLPTLPALFGAMLAGVDCVLMGAGIPLAVPGVLDRLAAGEAVQLKLDVAGLAPGEEITARFDPRDFCRNKAVRLNRPKFLPIIASSSLAAILLRKASGQVDGFVVEGASSGGHNAPPRGPLKLNERGEPVYGPRDVPDLAQMRAMGLPFWLAGGYGSPGKLAEARQMGAAGIQVGTAFAFCEESCIAPEVKLRILEQARRGMVDVLTDPVASPTGFPFKVVQLSGSLSDPDVYARRQQVCDVGYLCQLYRKGNGSIGHRCPAEPPDEFTRKGGNVAELKGRKCICNALLANIGVGQLRSVGEPEPPLLTAGTDTSVVARLLTNGRCSYTAADVVRYLMGDTHRNEAPALVSDAGVGL